jgi:regulator of replication initiation timing
MSRNSKDLFRHVEELIERNERLCEENKRFRTENSTLRAENKRLRERLDLLETTTEARISSAVEEAVAKATAPLLKAIEEKDKEILRLKAQIGKDSSNSSKPPGSDGFKKIPNSREKSVKKQGGQHGHKGHRLNIPENLAELVCEGKAQHIVLSDVGDEEQYVSDWTIDLKMIPVFTEYRRKPGLPPKIEYGTNLKVLAVYLCVIGLVALKRLSEFFREITHGLITVSKATLAEFTRQAAERIDVECCIQDLLNGKVINVDETPIKTSERPTLGGKLEISEKTTFSAYIRTYSNENTTVLTANPHKTQESVCADNILTQFHGIVSQDHESKFYHYGTSNATCGAHLTRELKGMSELQMLTWAEDVRQFFLEMNRHKNNDMLEGKTFCDPILLSRFQARYDELLKTGRDQLACMKPKSFGYEELNRMVNRLEKYKENYLLFICNYDAPFTNNLAERDLRHCKTKQKVSGCFRSWQGVLDYCVIRSLLATAKKRGISLFDSLFSSLALNGPAGL